MFIMTRRQLKPLNCYARLGILEDQRTGIRKHVTVMSCQLFILQKSNYLFSVP